MTKVKSNTDVRIVAITERWVKVGAYEKTPEGVTLRSAFTIRVWGTNRGLGQLAAGGPRKQTVLDPDGIVHIPDHAVLFDIVCNPDRWPDITKEIE